MITYLVLVSKLKSLFFSLNKLVYIVTRSESLTCSIMLPCIVIFVFDMEAVDLKLKQPRLSIQRKSKINLKIEVQAQQVSASSYIQLGKHLEKYTTLAMVCISLVNQHWDLHNCKGILYEV